MAMNMLADAPVQLTTLDRALYMNRRRLPEAGP